MRLLCLALALWLALGASALAQVFQLNYEGFTTWVDCQRRGPILFHYIAHADSGNLARHGDYELDPDFPAFCQSKTNDTFQSVVPDGAQDYDVGHQVPANHFDGSETAIAQTNFWTNLLPQTASMNRGAWLETEHIIECLRDVVPLEVWGGPIWGANQEDDHFAESHGVQTPAAFWKVVIRTDTREAIGWIIPNGVAPRSSLDQWIEPVSLIERVSGLTFEAFGKGIRSVPWEKPLGCSLQ